MGTDDLLPTFAILLRRYRQAAGLTQEELAERAGMSARGLMYLERGARGPYRGTLRRLGQALDLAPEEQEALAAAARLRTMPGPLAGSAAPLYQMPIPPTLLIGREADVATALALLARQDVRLLTLTGPGGVGKTRLALQVAGHAGLHGPTERVRRSRPAARPALLPAALALALGMGDAGDQPLLETVRHRLATRRMLLVLDNFEQVLAAAPVCGRPACHMPGLKCLVTSREPLHLTLGARAGRTAAGAACREQPRPAGHRPAPRPSPCSCSGRGRSCPASNSTADNAAAVAEICIRLDGLPLAIELAAARIKLLAPAAIRADSGSRLALLAGGCAMSPTPSDLRAALDWSYELLEPAGSRAVPAPRGLRRWLHAGTAQAVCMRNRRHKPGPHGGTRRQA